MITRYQVIFVSCCFVACFLLWNIKGRNLTAMYSSLSSLIEHLHFMNHTSINLPNIDVNGTDCAKLIAGNATEIKRAIRYQRENPKRHIPDEHYISQTKDCNKFREKNRYIKRALSTEEEDFPIAYSMLVYKDLEQVERLLRAIYQPQNFYCLHVDQKSGHSFKKAVAGIINCFGNVFMASHQISVKWGTDSVLLPEIICMGDLLKLSKKWRYFINLTGQEWPLKTNLELVKILKTFNGANEIDGSIKSIMWDRFRGKGAPPHGIRLTKGSAHIAASRGYVHYVIHHKVARHFLAWVRDTAVPDETYFNSLNYNPQLNIPGAYKGYPESSRFIGRYKVWGQPCAGKIVRELCWFGVGDLRHLGKNRFELFANKFDLYYQPLTLDCMEQLHYNNIRDELLGKRSLDLSFYKNLSKVNNHV